MDLQRPESATTKKSSNIFTMTDDELKDHLEFRREVGFGNWGSVWCVRPLWNFGEKATYLWRLAGFSSRRQVMLRCDASTRSRQARAQVQDAYHRCSSQVSVRAINFTGGNATDELIVRRWNEMKIHRHFKNDTHPSIVRFHSFVITPSYALITMYVAPPSPRPLTDATWTGTSSPASSP